MNRAASRGAVFATGVAALLLVALPTGADRDSEPVPARFDDSAPTGSAGASGMPSLDCVISPSEVVDVGSPVDGLLAEISVERGDTVERGQVLARLDSSMEKATVAVARAQADMQGELRSREASLEFGQRKQERVEELFQRKAVAHQERDEATTDAEVAQHQLVQAKENSRLAKLELDRAIVALRQRTIRSPISGVVTDRMLSVGERVDEQALLRIAQIDPLRVEVIAQAKLFGTIREGMQARVMPESPADGSHMATVTIVDPVIDAASGTFGIRLELPNPQGQIPGGLRCQVEFGR